MGWGGVQKSGRYNVAQINIKLPGATKRTKTNVARLSKMICVKNFEIRGVDASHLCHNSLCVNPDHINFETHEVNNMRHTCVSIKKNAGWPILPNLSCRFS